MNKFCIIYFYIFYLQKCFWNQLTTYICNHFRPDGIASPPHVKLAPISAPGPTVEREEHLEAVISFGGAGQRRRPFRGLHILTTK